MNPQADRSAKARFTWLKAS